MGKQQINPKLQNLVFFVLGIFIGFMSPFLGLLAISWIKHFGSLTARVRIDLFLLVTGFVFSIYYVFKMKPKERVLSLSGFAIGFIWYSVLIILS
jgi:hypothetical protein